jgi:hypothetical protein
VGKVRRPKPVGDAGVRARVVRGPEGKLWYWSFHARVGKADCKLESGWHTEAGAALRAAELAADRAPNRAIAARLARTDECEIRSVRDLCETYSAHVDGLVEAGERKTKTARNTTERLRVWTRRIGSLPLAHVGTETLAAHRDARRADGLMASTVGLELTIFLAAWRWARREAGLRLPLPERPHVARASRAPVDDGYTPTADEVDAVIAWLRTWEGDAKGTTERGRERNRRQQRESARRSADMLALQRLYGARIDEVSSLTVGAVTRATVTLTGKEGGKTGARTLPLVDDARPIVGPRISGREPEAWLWGCTPGIAERRVWEHLELAIEALEQPRWYPHALRALWADEAEAGGASLLQIAGWQGNSPEVIARHYRKVRAPELRELARKRGLVSNVAPLQRRDGDA